MIYLQVFLNGIDLFINITFSFLRCTQYFMCNQGRRGIYYDVFSYFRLLFGIEMHLDLECFLVVHV